MAMKNMFFILALVVILSITPLSSSLSPSDKVTQELLNQLCSTSTLYTHFCIAWLKSDPTLLTLDMHGLIGSVIDKTELLGLKNLAAMKGYARTTTDPELKFPYGTCVTDYELAIKAIEGAKGYVISKSYSLASNALFKAFDSISSCEADLEGKKNVPANVTRFNLFFERMCSIDKVFVDAITS